MQYLIDGHNLIPKIPGMSLRQMDDEVQLIELLQEFCRRQRKPVEVYFDKAPAGQAGTRKYGAVKAHFVRQGSTADAAIRRRLESLGKKASEWTVVSSDQAVQNSARFNHARVESSEAFARLLLKALLNPMAGEATPEPKMSRADFDELLKAFGGDEEE